MHVYVWRLIAFTPEPLDTCSRNLIGMKYSWAHKYLGFSLDPPGVDTGGAQN